MLSLIPLVAVSFAIAYVFAVLRMVTAALEAPIGYENEEGFHYGIEVPVPADVVASR